MPPVTIVGLGLMGSALARGLLAAGHDVTVWNRSTERAVPLGEAGATVAGSFMAAVAATPLTIMCVTSHDVVRALLDEPGASEALRGRTLVQLSAGTAEDFRGSAAWAAEHGVRYLSGLIVSVPGAISTDRATLFYCGPRDVFDEHRSTLGALGRTQWRSEDPAMIIPFTVATLSFAMVTGVAYVHGAALADAQGMSLDDYSAVTTACMPLVEELMRDAHAGIAAGTYEPHQASVNSYGNAIEHLQHEAEKAGIAADMPAALASYFRQARDAGSGDLEWYGVFEGIRHPRTTPST